MILAKEAAAEVEGEVLQAKNKRKPGGWRCMPYIIANETFERVASTGLLANFTVYLTGHLHMKQVVSVNVTNVFAGTANFAPLLGAFISDAYWGRFRTLAFASVATFLGMLVLTLTAALPPLQPSICSDALQQAGQCPGPSKLQFGVLILSLALLSLGAAGVRPCSLPFGVDQFDQRTEEGQRSLNSFFNWYYCTSTAGTVLALTLMVYIQDNVSWSLGFGIPSLLMILSILFFLLGSRLYLYVPPEGSPFAGIARVFVASFKKRSLQLPDVAQQQEVLYNPPPKSDRITKLLLTMQFRFLNKAAIRCEGDLNEDGSVAKPWRLCSVQQVEEVKCLIRIVPIWASGISCFVALGQQWTFAVLQCLKMDRQIGHFKIPAGSLATISLLALTLFIPVYDQLLVPLARRFTGIQNGITLLQRQGIGMVIAVFSMIVAAYVEVKRRNSALAQGGANGVSSMSAMWLAPQLVLIGIAEAFNAVGQIEFYNRQFPEHMQTIAGSLFYCTLAGAGYVSTIVVSIIQNSTGWLNDNINLGRVDYFYYVLAAMGVANFLYFLVASHYYRYKEDLRVENSGKEISMVESRLAEHGGEESKFDP